MDGVLTRCLSIGGVVFRFDGPAGWTLPALYTPFACASGAAHGARYTVVDRPQACAPGGDTLWSGPSWRLVRRAGRMVIEVRDPFGGAWRCAAETDAAFADGRLYPWRDGGGIPEAPVDRVLLVNRLALQGVAVLHASAVRIDGGVYLFCGRSGIGKSTMAQLWRAHARGVLLNDDRALVFLRGRDPLGGAAPWHGKEPAVDPVPGPLRGIFHLAQAPVNRLDPLGEGDAVARLLATGVVPLYHEAAVDRLAATFADLCGKVPSFDLAFRPDREVLRLVDTRLGLDGGAGRG